MPLRASFRCLVLAACLVSHAPLHAQSAAPIAFDLHGNPVHQLAGPGVRAVVLIFAASDCPISNRYVPEIARLTHEFAPQSVRFWWVYPNAGDTAQIVEQHNRDFAITESASSNTLLDPKQSLVAWAHATVTPEAAIFLVQGDDLREVYHGRIDDRYISLGQERPQPQHRDLELAITAALAGKPIPQPEGPPVGCSIVFLQK